MNESGGEPTAPLPAPYVSPWIRLAQDLRAVAASLRLKGRELWRRNREADLPVPRFWPDRLRTLFWPLVMALLLATPVGLLRLAPAGPRPQPSSGPAVVPAVVPAIPIEQEPVRSEESGLSDQGEPGELIGQVEEVPEPAPDPLLALLAGEDPQNLIAAALADPAQSLLSLTLRGDFQSLSPEVRGRWGERWLVRAESLGYERLELRDETGRLLARRAVVGSGMILFDSDA